MGYGASRAAVFNGQISFFAPYNYLNYSSSSRKCKIHVFFRALIVCFSFSIAIPAVCQVRNLKFEHKGIEDGLSHSNVICILQDSRGFVWFGTRHGLNKYDGYAFTIYKNNIDDAQSISNDRIADMLEDEDGNIWIATIDGGLDMFDWKQENFIHHLHNPDDWPASREQFTQRYGRL